MDVSVEQVKELRSKTGAGMMDCKKALMESGGNFEKAIEYLRKKGSLTSQKRSDRIAKEGLIMTKTANSRSESAIVEVNCETDFVAKSDAFIEFINGIVDAVLKAGSSNLSELINQPIRDGLTIQQALDETTGKVGEKVEIKRIGFFRSADGFFCNYNHLHNKVASIVEIKGDVTDKGIELGNDLAMQVVAMKPLTVERSQIPAELIEKEKEIYLTQAKNEKKPENIAEKIASNRVEKFFQENVLIEQEFVKEPGKTVKDIINSVSKETSKNYSVKTIVRYQLGETV